MSPRRRRLAVVVAVALAGAAAGGVGAVTLAYRGALRTNAGQLRFATPLRIPPLLEATTDPEGRRVFELTAAEGRARLVPGGEARTWGYDGAHLGPTLRAAAGDRVVVRVSNELPVATTVHWHGMHLPAAADGGPHQLIAPGATWTPSWTVDQPAATLWYHGHPEGSTGDQVYRGLAGLFLVDDAATPGLGLPHDYGVDDIPLVVQDKRFTAAGDLDHRPTRFSPVGSLGDTILVNGTYDPYLAVTTERVRLRVLNASVARTLRLGFDDGRAFQVVAGDAGLLDRPATRRRLLLAPSERAELVVTVEAGRPLTLRSFPTGLGGGSLPDRFAGGDDHFDILRLRPAATLAPSVAVPGRLPAPPPVAAPAGTAHRSFRFNHASAINGRSYRHDRVDFTVAAGSTEVWDLVNDSDNQHVFHVHGVSFTVLEWDGRPPPAEWSGLKDSVLLPRGTRASLAVRFDRYADAEAPYMFHCHVLAHEDHG
ncbi:MAG TPA: multicopper oxidase domain-containing protein, partial [Acidimicrobiales bacterium]|nr:multicopper oxidase domain-containing protein [Acidimicrobiales bacterium]